MPVRCGGPLMRSLIIIPTYNERENLADLLRLILFDVPTTDVLVVDDHSPDGTGELADEMSAKDARVHVMHRPGKMGLGTAYIQGFSYAIEQGYDLIFEMDADFSHNPQYLPAFIQTAQHADLVIGSRYIPGGGTPNWSPLRRFISGGGNAFARTVLRLPAHDCTAGYRCYHRHTLEAIDFSTIDSQGYAFQVELVYRVIMAGMTVAEVPIVFIDRRVGKSKMSRAIFIEGFRYVLRTWSRSGRVPRSSRNRAIVEAPSLPEHVSRAR